MGEWIEWKGGLCPVPFTAAVQVQYRSGNLSVGSFIADEFKWSHVGCTADIIAYRVIEPEQPSEQAHMMAAPTTREPAPDPLQAHVEMIAALTAERDSLRAEVERLNEKSDLLPLDDKYQSLLRRFLRMNKHYAALCRKTGEQHIERLRKGREDEKGAHTTAEAARVEDARKLAPIHADLAKAKTLASNFTDLDPRLGTPQPEGEPVGPMSQRKPYRWGMV